MILPIYTYGQPVLRKQAQDIALDSLGNGQSSMVNGSKDLQRDFLRPDGSKRQSFGRAERQCTSDPLDEGQRRLEHEKASRANGQSSMVNGQCSTVNDLKQLIADMFETMYKSDGVGLAAPQIGKAIRLVVVTLDPLKEDFPEYAGFNRAYINPHILEFDDSETETLEEGCLSLPGIHEPVKRPKRIRMAWVDEELKQHDEWIDGYLARVLQHEVDHLEGKVFTDRIAPLRKQLVKSKLSSLQRGKVNCHYRVKPMR